MATRMLTHYYVHVRTITLKKGMNLHPSSYKLESITAVLLQGWFGIKYPPKTDMPLNKESKPNN